MKKLLLLVITLLLLTGCGKVTKDNLRDHFIEEVESAKSYYVEANMDIYNAEDVFSYDLKVYYKDDNLFKVRMMNTVNNHEQIIVRDADSVYVATPSLNKSYKFKSEWPYNSSQSYILHSLVKDLQNDADAEILEENDGYALKVKVNYPNNSDLVYEKIFFDKNKNLKNVYVYDEDDILVIKVTFNKVDYKANLKEEEFDINKVVEENCCQTGGEEQTTSSLEDIMYPMYIPTNTYLKDKETIQTENGERVILTFNGDKNFVLIEEVSNVYDEFEVVPVYGDPLMLSNTIGALSSNSLSWSSNNIDYYLASTDLSTTELLTIADSMNGTIPLEK